jgi:invasion protein IalB
MSDLNLNELDHFSDEEIVLLEEMCEMMQEMTQEEYDDFVAMVEIMGKKKKENNFLLVDRSEFYH